MNKPDEWKEHLQMVEEAFKTGARAYASCLSGTAGPIFDLRAGLGGLEDEDMIQPYYRVPGHDDLGPSDGPAGYRENTVLP